MSQTDTKISLLTDIKQTHYIQLHNAYYKSYLLRIMLFIIVNLAIVELCLIL